MKLRDFGLLTDENLDPDVVAFLRRQGFDVSDVCEDGLQGSTDIALLQRAAITNCSGSARLSIPTVGVAL